ncbi:MAG: CoB--CoM heterodisulfide reductase iron-sulfur subunit B family protein [Candidatus Marinimicrobia bacterium]|nr:CoB--CoM heterodisulfide reductase iron-sulfur subunit B family protein [Candidatus Neomarinimicrobiota bacterium]
MSYLYYPGCSCSGNTTGRAYSESLIAVFDELGLAHDELEDWNCCGATMYMSVDENQAFGMAARNLALAEKQGANGNGPATMVTPCSACYAVLSKAQHAIEEQPRIGNRIQDALQEVGLAYTGRVQVRHPLDILVNDVGLENIADKVKNPLTGLRIACYYGCLLARPYPIFDNPYDPSSMDDLMRVLGAEPVDWSLKTRCCGASLSGTIEDVGLSVSAIILAEAQRKGADLVATACPFCQFNLECFQPKMIKKHGLPREMPVAFFTQLLGRALGIPEKKLGIKRLFRPLSPSKTKRETESYEYN